MKKIIRVFLYDISHIKKNVIAMIVALGLCVVPSLYAWFNIAASWDPYSNTKGLKVAVANTDEGYEGEVLPLTVNIGDTVISSLRENDQLNWTFTGKKEAVEGVRSGKYYAAIVIPEHFSQDMMSLFSEDVTHSDILYYLNEKENAIAPKVTDKGASAVQKQIDEVFVKTAAQAGLDLLDMISEVTDREKSDGKHQKDRSRFRFHSRHSPCIFKYDGFHAADVGRNCGYFKESRREYTDESVFAQ